jgi:secreted trypsin-like serine protease
MTNSKEVRMRSKLILLLALGFVFGACSKDEKTSSEVILSPPPADCSAGQIIDVGVIQGQKVKEGSWIEKHAVFLMARNGKICTASIVGNNILLTAAHCVDGSAKYATLEASPAKAVFAANPACLSAESKSEREIFYQEVLRHPEYISEGKDKSKDVALIRLMKSVPAGFAPAEVASSEVFTKLSDASVTFVGAGYGNIKGYEKGYDFFPRLNATKMKLITEYGYGIEDELYFDQRETGICSGDSGGAIFAKVEGRPVIVGVNSWVAAVSPNTDSCREYAAAMSVEKNRIFLKNAFEKLAPGQKNPF